MMRRLMVGCVSSLCTAGIAIAAEVIEQSERTDQTRAALREAGGLVATLDQPANLERFHGILQPLAVEQLPKLPVTIHEKAPPFNKLTLNRGGEGLDAFVFDAPVSALEGVEGPTAYNLAWEFVLPAPVPRVSWYILPAKGTMKGFEWFSPGENKAFDDSDIPAENYAVSQRLDGGRLKPGERYIIWFWFEDNQPREIFARLTLQPVK